MLNWGRSRKGELLLVNVSTHTLKHYINYIKKAFNQITRFIKYLLSARNSADLQMSIRAVYLNVISFIRSHCVLLHCMSQFIKSL